MKTVSTPCMPDYHFSSNSPSTYSSAENGTKSSIVSPTATYRIGTLRPDLELLDRGGAKRIGCADQWPLPVVLQQVGQLADGCRLTRAVDPDHQRDLRAIGHRQRAIDRGKHRADLLLHQIAQARSVARPPLDGGDNPIGRGHPDVGRDQHFLERFDGVDVNRSGSAIRLVGAAHDIVEPIDDLLLGAGKTVAEAVQDAHVGIWVIG